MTLEPAPIAGVGAKLQAGYLPVLPVPPLAPGEPEAVFVVGVPRSGTTLVRMILGKHSRIAIADENHYLGHFLPWADASFDIRGAGDLASDDVIRRLVTRIYSDRIQHGTWLREPSPYWRWLARRVPRDELETRLLGSERTERGVFTALLRAYSDRKGKPVYGEKTPSHFRHAETVLEWYPTARVIHMIRDPRAVYLSEVKRRMARPESVPYRWLVHVPGVMRAFLLVQVVVIWASAVGHHRRLLRRYPERYRLVRFEDLVREPESIVRDLCAFMGVTFEPRMLRQRVVSVGDRLGERGFDSGAADRWRDRITPREMRWIGRLLGGRIAAHGYPER